MITIACKIETFDSISYREVIRYYRDAYYLVNVNIILGNKVVKKIRFEEGERKYSKGIGKKICETYLEEKLRKKANPFKKNYPSMKSMGKSKDNNNQNKY